MSMSPFSDCQEPDCFIQFMPLLYHIWQSEMDDISKPLDLWDRQLSAHPRAQKSTC
jgi:hypothetical protein